MESYAVTGHGYTFKITRKVLDDCAVVESIYGPGPYRFRVIPPGALSTCDSHMVLSMESAIECALDCIAESGGEGCILWAHDSEPGMYSLEPWRVC